MKKNRARVIKLPLAGKPKVQKIRCSARCVSGTAFYNWTKNQEKREEKMFSPSL